MKKKLALFSIALIFLIFLFSCKSRNKWENFQGGSHFLVEVESAGNPSIDQQNILKAIEILSKRLKALDIKNAIVKKVGPSEIAIQVPPGSLAPGMINELTKTGMLELKVVDEALQPRGMSTMIVPTDEEILYDAGRQFIVKREPVISSMHIKDAALISPRASGVEVTFDKEGARLLEQVTAQNVGRRLAIMIDKKICEMPCIVGKVSGGKIVTGGYASLTGHILAVVLGSGSLPAPVNIKESKELTKDIWLGASD